MVWPIQRVRLYPVIAAALGAAAWGACRLRAWQLQAHSDAVLAERNRIARELHDSLAQTLLGASLQVEGALGSLGSSPDSALHHLERARELIRESLATARRSVWKLRDPTLAENDLDQALASAVEKLAGVGGTRLELRVSGQPRPLPRETMEHLYCIGQEAIANAVRHSRAEHVFIDLAFAGNRVILRVRDDGNGFPAGQSHGGRHCGLVHMAERVKQIAARLAIRGGPGQGTEIEVEASA